jgi:hypothetical protein
MGLRRDAGGDSEQREISVATRSIVDMLVASWADMCGSLRGPRARRFALHEPHATWVHRRPARAPSTGRRRRWADGSRLTANL